MMKSLELCHLFRNISAIPLNRGICTSSVLLRRRGVPRSIPEPGIRNRRAFLKEDFDDQIEHEGDLEPEVDIMNIDSAYDMNESGKAKNKRKVQYFTTARKFFSSRPQPLMLTCNERHCIRYLHKTDPVQWDLQTLSESFPATTDTIKKIIKGKWKITPERAKVLDSKAQKNWELLAEGKLDADPHVLEHLKKFVNRREVLLEQVKNVEFYLPEIKREPVWNRGEFSRLLGKYEKDVQMLVKEAETKHQPKMLEDGVSTDEQKSESSLDYIHEKINETVSVKRLENKDSFFFGELTNFHSKDVTLEDLEEKILKRADAKKKLNLMEKAILENKLGISSKQNLETLPEVPDSTAPKRIEENAKERLTRESKHFVETDSREESKRSRVNRRLKEYDVKIEMGDPEVPESYIPESIVDNTKERLTSESKRLVGNDCKEESTRSRRANRRLKEYQMMVHTENPPPDERTKFSDTTGVGKLLSQIRNPHNTTNEEAQEKEERNVEVKPQVDFTDPERLQREKLYYDKEVDAIRNTAFWNSGRSSEDKAAAELQKYPDNGPDLSKLSPRHTTAILSEDRYPERINIPKNMRRSGLTFKVKDCYYDDDGEFLYRVPGMVK